MVALKEIGLDDVEDASACLLDFCLQVCFADATYDITLYIISGRSLGEFPFIFDARLRKRKPDVTLRTAHISAATYGFVSENLGRTDGIGPEGTENRLGLAASSLWTLRRDRMLVSR